MAGPLPRQSQNFSSLAEAEPQGAPVARKKRPLWSQSALGLVVVVSLPSELVPGSKVHERRAGLGARALEQVGDDGLDLGAGETQLRRDLPLGAPLFEEAEGLPLERPQLLSEGSAPVGAKGGSLGLERPKPLRQARCRSSPPRGTAHEPGYDGHQFLGGEQLSSNSTRVPRFSSFKPSEGG